MFDSAGSLLDGSMPVGPIEPATKRGWSGVAYLSHAARASRAAATLMLADLVAEPPLREPARRRLEGARLDDVAADREERLVDRLDDVGAREDEVVVAALERLAAEVVGREVVALDVRAHRAVVDEDALGEGVEIRMGRRRCGRIRSLGASTKRAQTRSA